MNKNYFPILKNKKGELDALRNLTAEHKNKINPIFECLTIKQKDIADDIFNAIGNTQEVYLYLDLGEIEENDALNFSSNTIQNEIIRIYDRANQLNMKLIPVIELSEDLAYYSLIKIILKIKNNGICLRVYANNDEFFNSNFKSVLDKVISEFELPLSNWDLLIDLKDVVDSNINLYKQILPNAINSLPYLNEWRNIILAGTNFPMKLDFISARSTGTVGRLEWELWTNLYANSTIIRKPSFSDYGINNHSFIDFDYTIMTIGSGIRYTAVNVWYIMKGYSYKNGGASHSHQMCQDLIAQNYFMGRGYSWGDNYIYECANRSSNPGNKTTWVSVGTNHHIALICDQIDNLP